MSDWFQRATLPRRVGVVVATRRRADLLPAMLRCLKVQSYQPARILVVEDDSGRDKSTADVCRAYGVEHVKQSVGDGTSGNPARNVGLRMLDKLPYLCFLDDDDMIPPNYLETLIHTAERDCRVAATYPKYRFCGERSALWEVPYSPHAISRTNCSGAAALLRTDALLQVGGWPMVPTTKAGYRPHDDWALWRRLRDHGWRLAQASVEYFYHKIPHVGICATARANHELEWIDTIDSTWNLVTIAIPWSGREWCVDRILEAIDAQTWPHDRISLLFYDNSADPVFGRKLRQWLAGCDDFAETRYVRDNRPPSDDVTAQGAADGPIADGHQGRKVYGELVNHRVGALWNRIGQLVGTDLVWCVEDDTVPPPHALENLLRRMDPQTDAVCGCYPSRVVPTKMVAWNYESNTFTAKHLSRGAGVETIHGTGFGCVLIRRELFTEVVARSGGESVGYDCNFWLDAARSGRVLKMDWDLVCDHLSKPSRKLKVRRA